eukprot:918884_1
MVHRHCSSVASYSPHTARTHSNPPHTRSQSAQFALPASCSPSTDSRVSSVTGSPRSCGSCYCSHGKLDQADMDPEFTEYVSAADVDVLRIKLIHNEAEIRRLEVLEDRSGRADLLKAEGEHLNQQIEDASEKLIKQHSLCIINLQAQIQVLEVTEPESPRIHQLHENVREKYRSIEQIKGPHSPSVTRKAAYIRRVGRSGDCSSTSSSKSSCGSSDDSLSRRPRSNVKGLKFRARARPKRRCRVCGARRTPRPPLRTRAVTTGCAVATCSVVAPGAVGTVGQLPPPPPACGTPRATADSKSDGAGTSSTAHRGPPTVSRKTWSVSGAPSSARVGSCPSITE